MAKLILLFTALALFLLISNTSIYEAGVNNRAPQQSKCKNEIHQQHQLRACHQWFHKRAQRVQSAYIAAEKFEVITEDDLQDEVNQSQQHQYSRSLNMCCNELHQVESICVCLTLQKAVQQVVTLQGQQRQHMFKIAENLPNFCNIQNHVSCHFSASTY